MDDYPRVPSRVISLNDTINYNRQDGQIAPQGNQHHMMMLQPPPLLIHTVPSHVSNRSVSNRSVSNRSISNRSVSNRSVHTSATRGRHPNNSATQGAELIAIATAQARAAAQSILMTGGSQAAALSTATAAAKSVLIPVKEDSRGKPPMGSTRNSNFRNRRKNRQQAEIIASMALVSANETLDYGSMGHDMMMMTPGGLRSAYNDERDSEFPDDYTNYRSLGPSIYGRTHSVRSQKEMQQLRYPEYYDQSRQDKQTILPFKALEPEIKSVAPIALQDQSIADQITLDSKIHDNSISLKSDKPPNLNQNLTRIPSVKGLFQGIQGPGKFDIVAPTEPLEKAPRMKIPPEMPMPKSNPIKAIASLKGASSGKQHAKTDRNSTPRSRQQLSESQVSCYSDHSSVSHTNSYGSTTYDEHTADYTRGTFESVVDSRKKSTYVNRSSGASFFSTMDPFVQTFSEVFSCGPVPPSRVSTNPSQSDMINRRLKIRESRDSTGISQFNSVHNNTAETRDPPVPQQRQASIHLSTAAPRRSTSVEDSILSTNDIQAIDQGAEAKGKETFNSRKKISSPTMEQLVLRALSAISPKGAAAKRPKLNVKPLKQSGNPVIPAAHSAKYRPVNDVNNKANNKRTRKDVVVNALSRASVKPSKNRSESLDGGAMASIESHSSGGNQQPQQEHHHQPQSSSSSCDYYVSASTDDSANVTAPVEPTMPATTNHKTVVSNSTNQHHLDHKTKRFPSFSFHRSKRAIAGNPVE